MSETISHNGACTFDKWSWYVLQLQLRGDASPALLQSAPSLTSPTRELPRKDRYDDDEGKLWIVNTRLRYAVKFNDLSSGLLSSHIALRYVAPIRPRWVVARGGVAGVESGANPDRVHSQFQVEVDKSDSYVGEMAHFEINFVPRLNPRTFQFELPLRDTCCEREASRRLRSKVAWQFIATYVLLQLSQRENETETDK